MGKLWEQVKWSWLQHKVSRVSYLSPAGSLRCFEVLPIVAIVILEISCVTAFFSLYYLNSRTDVQPKCRPPLFESMCLKNPKVCKMSSNDYKTYQPNQQLVELMKEMKCLEKQRKRCNM